MERPSDDIPNRIVHEIQMRTMPPGDRVLTTGDLADDLGVSDQTIRNHIDAVLEHPGINTRKIRGAPVFWHEPESAYNGGPRFGGLGGSEAFFPTAWERRGHWQGLRQHLVKDAGAGAPAEKRAKYLWELFRTHDQLMASVTHKLNSLRADDNSRGVPDEFYQAFEPAVSSDTIRYYFDERTYFETDAYGEVVGLFDFEDYYRAAESEFENDVLTVELDELDAETIDAWVPSCAEILDTGDALVDITSEIYNWKW
jgi:hypothetical protein